MQEKKPTIPFNEILRRLMAGMGLEKNYAEAARRMGVKYHVLNQARRRDACPTSVTEAILRTCLEYHMDLDYIFKGESATKREQWELCDAARNKFPFLLDVIQTANEFSDPIFSQRDFAEEMEYIVSMESHRIKSANKRLKKRRKKLELITPKDKEEEP